MIGLDLEQKRHRQIFTQNFDVSTVLIMSLVYTYTGDGPVAKRNSSSLQNISILHTHLNIFTFKTQLIWIILFTYLWYKNMT